MNHACVALCVVLCVVAIACGGGEEGAAFVVDAQPRIAVRAAIGGNPPPESVIVRNSGACDLALVADAATVDGLAWLSVTPPTATVAAHGSAEVVVAFDVMTPGLRAGTYTGSVFLGGTCLSNGRVATGSPLILSINLTVSEQ